LVYVLIRSRRLPLALIGPWRALSSLNVAQKNMMIIGPQLQLTYCGPVVCFSAVEFNFRSRAQNCSCLPGRPNEKCNFL